MFFVDETIEKIEWFGLDLDMPLNKPIPEGVMRLWRRVRRYELTRTLRATEKRMEYVRKSLAYIDRVEGRSRN